MSPKAPVPVEYLRTCVTYDPETGMFTWLRRDDLPQNWNSRFAGKPAFTFINRHGYCEGVILYQKIRAHRAAWALVYGEWPDILIDHKDGDKLNNRIENLRLATRGQNATNCRSQCGTSQFLGVYWEKTRQKWRARIMHDRQSIDLGFFADERAAARAYDAAAIALHGEFANPNFATTNERTRP